MGSFVYRFLVHKRTVPLCPLCSVPVFGTQKNRPPVFSYLTFIENFGLPLNKMTFRAKRRLEAICI